MSQKFSDYFLACNFTRFQLIFTILSLSYLAVTLTVIGKVPIPILTQLLFGLVFLRHPLYRSVWLAG